MHTNGSIAAANQLVALFIPTRYGFAYYAQSVFFAGLSIDQWMLSSADAEKKFEYALWPVMTVRYPGWLTVVDLEASACTTPNPLMQNFGGQRYLRLFSWPLRTSSFMSFAWHGQSWARKSRRCRLIACSACAKKRQISDWVEKPALLVQKATEWLAEASPHVSVWVISSDCCILRPFEMDRARSIDHIFVF